MTPDELDETIPAFVATIGDLSRQVEGLPDAVRDLVARVEKLETKAKADSASSDRPARLLIDRVPVPPAGNRLRQAWADLSEWVHWLTTTYEVDSRMLPPCWYLHGWLVRELAALRCSHSNSLMRCKGEPRAMITWHVDWTAFLGRVRASPIGDKCTISHQSAATWRPDTPAVVFQSVFAPTGAQLDIALPHDDGNPPVVELQGRITNGPSDHPIRSSP